MKRRAFLSKTALAAIAAPFLPAALAKASSNPKWVVNPEWVNAGPVWRCEWRMASRVHVIETDEIRQVSEFIQDPEHRHGELKLWKHGELWYARPQFMIPIIYRRPV